MLIAIDAGHGSETAGKRTPDGYREHWINVRSAYYFEEAMKRCGLSTVRIGWNDRNSKDDADISLTIRQKTIKKAQANISVSWHANAYGDGWNNAEGIETLIHNNTKKQGDSKRLAETVQAYLRQGTKQKNRGVKSQELAMCNCTAMGTKASILIEIGFMTNKQEAELMKTDAFCKECAEEAARGVCAYLNRKYVQEDTEMVEETKIAVNGKEMAVKRILKDGTNYINLRELAEALGCTVTYDEGKKIPVITK